MRYKKIISIILILIMNLIIVCPITTFALDGFAIVIKNRNSAIQVFIDEIKEILSFEPEHVIETNSANNDENKDNKDFFTCRLIVKSDKKPQKLNSVGMASGFKDYYIIQFKNEDDTKQAYDYYSKFDYIDVCVDENTGAFTAIEFGGMLDATENVNASNEDENLTYDGVPDRLNSWGSEVSGAYAVKDYLTKNNSAVKNDVTVAVVDSGIEYDHDFFSNKKDRLERTNFTVVHDKKDDEYDVLGHGTAVTSVILDSTPDNVKVRNYKISDDGSFTYLDVTVAILQAAMDGADVINCSLSILSNYKNADWNMLSDALEEVYNQGSLIVCSAGNYINISRQPAVTLPSTSDYVLSVTGLEEDLKPTYSMGKCVDVSAPGVNIPTAYKSSYKYLDGTSFSSPITASVCAEILTLNPSYTPDMLIDRVKETAVPYDDSCGLDGMPSVYGTGFVDAVEATGIKRTSKIDVSLNEGDYKSEINLTLTTSDDAEIYYSVDQSYPTKENGILYKEPIKIYSDQFIVNAVAYSDNNVPSRLFSGAYRSSILEKESSFEIDEDGAITKYNGNLSDIVIPDTINSTEVTNILQSAFADSQVTGIVLPHTVKTLGMFETEDISVDTLLAYRSFYENQSLKYIDGESVEAIGDSVFYKCYKLAKVNFPKCKEIGECSFYLSNGLHRLNLPQVERLGIEALASCNMYKLWLPELKSCADEAFSNSFFYSIYTPKFSFVHDGEYTTMRPDILNHTMICNPLDWSEAENLKLSLWGHVSSENVFRIEFSKLKNLYDLPGPFSTLVLPSTMEYMPKDLSEYKDFSIYGNILPTYTIYGSSGTYVEEWANKNEIKFIKVTPETAVITDLPKYYKTYMGELEADVVGFNRQYQWYANDINSNEGGTPIEGATGKNFNPADYYAPYYYCVVTSKDGDFDPITIKTSACENRTQTADYTALDKALNEFDSSQSELYTAESWSDYSTAVAVGASIDRGLAKSKQNIIDAAIKEIINARNNLVRKNAVSARVIGTPTLGANAVVEITVNGSPEAIRFIDEEKNAVTFDRSSALTVKDGNNEIWRIKLAVTSEKTAYSIFIKYNEDYIDSGVTLTVTASSGPDLGIHSVSIPDMYPSGTYTDGRIYAGVHDVIIRTSKDVLKIQFIDPDGNTRTFSKYSTPPTEDGDELVWTIPLKFNLGKMNLGIRTRAVHTTFALTGEYVTGRVLF